MRHTGPPPHDRCDGREHDPSAAGYEVHASAAAMPASSALDADAVVVRLGALARSFQDLDDIEATVRAIVAAAVDTVPGTAYAGFSPVERRRTAAAVVTDQAISQIDQVQRDTGEGPALTSLREKRTVRVDNLATDPRWPRFAARTVELGVGSILAVHMSARRTTLGVLTLYSHDAHTFDHEAERLAQLLTAHAATAMAAAQSVQQLTTALSNRDAIGQAKGILMERHRLSADQAFTVLTHVSQTTNTKLVDVARSFIETGRLSGAPDTFTTSGKSSVRGR